MRRMNEPVVIVRNQDEASPFFVRAAASGETLTSVVIEFTRAVGSRTEVYQTVTLTNAIVSSVKTINGGIQPMEEVSFTFQKIEYENKDGAAAAPATWKQLHENSRARSAVNPTNFDGGTHETDTWF